MKEQVFDSRGRPDWDPGDDAPFVAGSGMPEPSLWGLLQLVPPGVILEGYLRRVRRSELSGDELVDMLAARQRQISHMQAELLADMVELGYCQGSVPGDPSRRIPEFAEATAEEVSAALAWTRRAAETTVGYAFCMIEQFPEVGEALHSGVIDLPRAKVIVDAVLGLDPDTARAVLGEILGSEGVSELTTGQLRARLRRVAIDADPEAAQQRYERAREDRRVVGGPNPDGTAYLQGENLEPERVAAILSRLDRAARRLRRHGDPRTIDQLRADLLLDWLEGDHGDSGGSSPRMVDIRVDLATLIGLNQRAGEIPGWGPVIADIARQALEEDDSGEWRVVVTDPDRDTVLWDGTTRRRPTVTQRRYVAARQPECSFPTCRAPAHRCDLDHRHEYGQGGPTQVDNLDPACRHHHQAKTQGRWRTQRTDSGDIVWISRHGHRYTKPP